MHISTACKTIRAWHDLMDPLTTRSGVPGGLPEAVGELRRYLESEAGNGRPIAELALPERVLVSREGLRQMMAFVLRAEAIVAAKTSRRSDVEQIASLTGLIEVTARRCIDLERALAGMAAEDADERAADEALRSAQHLLWLYKVHLARLNSRPAAR